MAKDTTKDNDNATKGADNATEDKGIGQRDANKEAAKIGFKILYNEGKEWPEDLYTGKSDVDKVRMHQGYMNMLVKLAKLGGVQSNKTIAFDL